MPRLLRSISLRLLPLLAAASLLCAGCIKEDVAENTARGNFDALWRIADEHYCFFAEKQKEYGLDWNEVYARYSAAVSDGLTDRQQFEIFGKMLAELRDGHTNLYAPFDVARYGKWFDDYP
ncbi:MAG: peptidase S41, partial [Alloprevotella sp.]